MFGDKMPQFVFSIHFQTLLVFLTNQMILYYIVVIFALHFVT